MTDAVRSGVVRLQVAGCDKAWTGSGFLISDDLIVTAGHVARDAATISAKSDRGIVRADVLAYDMSTDSALLRTQGPLSGHHFTIHKPKLGEDLAVLGYPLSVSDLHVDPGIVTGGDTSVTYDGPDGFTVDDAVITDAAINPGNSGGPAVNRVGQVVGLVSGSKNWTGDPADPAPAQGTNYLIPGQSLADNVGAWRMKTKSIQSDCGDQQQAPTSDENALTVKIDSSSPDAGNVALALYNHGDSINHGDYVAAWEAFTQGLQSHFGNDEESWANGLQTSYWTDLDVLSVKRAGPSATATVALRTQQDPEFGYHHESCSDYSMTYRMSLTDGRWLIDDADAGDGPVAC